ncbi:integrin alpha-4 isoform X1 [Poecilia latipinna]|uniref:integrin alpha-4 isoform X1 n=1 Tax=Poecilia latipinna TaxID=48699 RepID=UPI00072E01C6|nr:PREDICTED: integrin alpha-4 isoform X1 [Poecilia latipinna]
MGVVFCLVPVQVLVLVLVCPAAGYNLDQEHSMVFKGPHSSMFGYSVLLHRHNSEKWLLVGAPVAHSSHQLTQSPGAVFRCNIMDEKRRCDRLSAEISSCGKTCEPESDHQWLGVSLSRQPGENGGRVLACAHRWKNVYYSRKDGQNNKLPYGACFRYESDLVSYQHFIPCYKDHQRKFGEDYGSCQAGISNFLTQELIIVGAPGSSYWTGSVVVYNTSSNSMSVYQDDETGAVSYGSYLGYAVGAGHFQSPSSIEVVGGAPQYNQKGKAFIFSTENSKMLQVVSEVTGHELGSYFGSSLCVVDLNADGLSDLLVGAPMATGTSREEGRVHVYINQGEAQLKEAEFKLTGSDAYAARFGETIADLGDLDDDGYPDVAVGAPQEDDLRGAVYIYNGRKEGISPKPSQRITGSSLGHDLKMFGQSLNSGIDIDDNGYNDVAVGAFLSDSAVVLRTRPVVQVKASLILPEHIDQQGAQCQDHKTQTVCINVTICFSVTFKHHRGAIELQYNLTSDLLHKPSFPHRFYFHGNGSSNSTRGHMKARHGHPSCATHVAYQRKDVKDIYTPVQFEVSYGLSEKRSHKTPSRKLAFIKPILQHSAGHHNTITNQTRFARSCSMANCSTNMQLSSELVLPQQQKFFALGSGQIVLKTSLLNSGDDAFLPRVTLRFPNNIHYIKVLHNQEANVISCDVTEEVNTTDVKVDCRITSLVLPALSQVNISFLLDVSQNSTPGDIHININTSSDNYETDEFLRDNTMTLVLPLKHGVGINIHGFVTPKSFVFDDEDLIPADCYPEKFNYTFKVLNSGPSKALNTVVQIALPKILAPYPHRLLQLIDWKSSHGSCSISDKTISVNEDCNVPQASFIKQIIFFFSPTTTRTMFCGRVDNLCEQLVCRLGNLDAGRDATIQLEISLNPAVLLQAPGRHHVMMLESTATVLSPREDAHTVLIKDQPALVVVEAVFSQKPSMAVKIFIIAVSLVLGLTILTALIWCLWKCGFFKRNFKKQEELNRDSWDYVPKLNKRESSI